MNALTIVNFNEKPYYIADDVRTNAPAYFYGTAKSVRHIIEKKSIPQEHYTYGIKGLKTKQYTLSDPSSKKSTLFLSVDWVKTHIFPTENKDDTTETKDDDLIQSIEYENSPPIIYLNDDEKIRDGYGNILEIETCGTNTTDGLYFYSKDVERAFQLVSIARILNQKESRYVEGMHYKKFIRRSYGQNNNDPRNNHVTTYLTYRGLLQLIFTRRYSYKVKERSVVNFITNTFSEYKIINDRPIVGGYSKRRPDILIYANTHYIIIEIDENRHTKYKYNSESPRMMEISKDLGNANIVFIRFNPDSYTDDNGNYVKSCWYVNSKGICEINDNNKWNERLVSLKNCVEHWLHNIPDKHITIVKLFYTDC